MGRLLGAAALLALALLPVIAVRAQIRGLDPALAPRYQPAPDGTFACLDGKKSIPFEQVNDDYCDCFDGSDEPGTSACPNGHFYCENKYFLPLRLNSSMVDDGVCDCCDGSDEPAGRCQNECYNKGHEDLIALKEKAAAAEKGVAARDKYVREAAGTKAQWAARKAEVESQLGQRRREKEQAEEAKAKLEEEQRRIRDRKQKLEEEQEKRAAEAAADAQPGDEAAAVEEEAAAEEAADAAEQQGAEGDGEAGKSEEELAKERMAQWIPGAKDGGSGDAGDAAAGEEAADAEAEAEAEALPAYDGEDAAAALDEEEEQQFFPDGDAGGDDADPGGAADGGGGGDGGAAAAGGAAGGAADAGDAGAAPTSAFGKARLLLTKLFAALTGKSGGSLGGDGDLAAAIAAAEAELEALNKRLTPARTRATEARTKLSELEGEERKLAGQLEGAYGADDAFVALVGRCFDARVDKYTYSVCPYDRASQKEGSSSTSLGTWAGLEGGEALMAFRNGQSCWQGPARSMTVKLLCGQTERLAKVEEPSRCEYTAELETPAACTASAAEALRLQVQARQRLLAGEEEEDPAAFRDEL